ncbi:hypothetical protein [Pedobacter sp. L105]|uniref:hypothetical protein n=1 Tax=Pedobacter sp. L105 TaxID=1641871 RepID=UPI00131D2C1D|nr:hypothetical protein [Pedobacter sp. L105]
MKITIDITLPEDFYTLLSIYQIKPDVFVQYLANQISFPVFYSHPTGSNRWATYFFLDFLESEESEYEVNEELEAKYLKVFKRAIGYNFDQTTDEFTKSEQAGREIMNQWLKAVLAERTRYITDNL